MWPTRIIAPPLAVEFYKMVGQLQQSDAFDNCHIYTGAQLHGEPMIKFKGRSTSLANVVASYIGLPNGKQQCDTPGCCNPFHYVPMGTADGQLVSADEEANQVLQVGLEEWAELIAYELDKRALRIDAVTFEQMREWIHPDDLTDEQVKAGIEYLRRQA